MSTPVEQVGPPVVTAHARRGPYDIQAGDRYVTGLSYADVVDELIDDLPGRDLADLVDAAIGAVR